MKDANKKIAVLIFLMLFTMLIGCSSSNSDSPAPEPEKLPVAYRIEVPDSITTEAAIAVPAAISEDGQVVVGTVYVFRNPGVFFPIVAFKWTLPDGISQIEVPGYFVSSACALGRDGSVIAGTAFNNDFGESVSWVWTANTGCRVIEAPEDTIAYFLHDVTADGSMVLGGFMGENPSGPNFWDLFVWSEEYGFVTLGRGGEEKQVLPVGISNDGLSVAYNCLDKEGAEGGACNPEGTWILKARKPEWENNLDSYVVYPPTIEQSEKQFYACDLTNGHFGHYSAHSSDLSVIGGFVNREWEDQLLVHPSIWMAVPGHINILTALGWNGYNGSISPDGTLAGFDSHFATGNPYAFIWSSKSGINELYSLMKHSDENLGSKLLETFAGKLPTTLMGFSADNNRAVGVSYSLDDPDSMFGFMIDNFEELIP